MTKVTVVIPSLANEQTYPYLKLCVESLRASGFDGNIIVVTNGGRSKPDLGDIFGITAHIHTREQGQCRAVNAGAELAPPDTKYLLISNDDMYYAPGWDRNLRFDHLCFSPNLVEPTNNAGSAAPFLKADAGYIIEEFQQGLLDHFVAMNISDDRNVEPGFNLPFFIDYNVWRTIGGYDEKYDPWGSNSDTDLQTKINLAGIVPMRLRDVLVYHFSNKSGTFDGTHQDAWQKNWDYFDQKWGFNRDILGSDVWYNTKMLPADLGDCNYQPDWMGKYLEA